MSLRMCGRSPALFCAKDLQSSNDEVCHDERACRGHEVGPFLKEFQFDALAIQEAGVTFASRAAFRAALCRRGLHVVCGDVDPRSRDRSTQAVLTSRFPAKSVVPDGVTDSHRAALAVVEIPLSGVKRDGHVQHRSDKVLIGSAYGHASDPKARRNFFKELFAFLHNAPPTRSLTCCPTSSPGGRFFPSMCLLLICLHLLGRRDPGGLTLGCFREAFSPRNGCKELVFLITTWLHMIFTA